MKQEIIEFTKSLETFIKKLGENDSYNVEIIIADKRPHNGKFVFSLNSNMKLDSVELTITNVTKIK